MDCYRIDWHSNTVNSYGGWNWLLYDDKVHDNVVTLDKFNWCWPDLTRYSKILRVTWMHDLIQGFRYYFSTRVVACVCHWSDCFSLVIFYIWCISVAFLGVEGGRIGSAFGYLWHFWNHSPSLHGVDQGMKPSNSYMMDEKWIQDCGWNEWYQSTWNAFLRLVMCSQL